MVPPDGLVRTQVGCAQMGAGTDYEAANVVAALQKGDAVVATDYAGYTTGGAPTDIVGAAEGHAVLDIVKVASQVPNAGVSASAPVALWGFSQGGQAAAWAAELATTYAPNVQLEGVAAGGTPADLAETARFLDGNIGATFEMLAIIGLANQYPELPIDAVLNPAGAQAFATLKTQCVFRGAADAGEQEAVRLHHRRADPRPAAGDPAGQHLHRCPGGRHQEDQRAALRRPRPGRRARAAGPGLRRQAALLRPRHQGDLHQDVTLPAGAAFSAQSNQTTKTLTGDLAVPVWDAPINVLGLLPLTAEIELQPSGTTGTVELLTDGNLEIRGTARARSWSSSSRCSASR
jgi:hypothetical protein